MAKSRETKVAILRGALPLAYFTGMAVLMTWPLVLNIGHSVAGQIGDNVYFVWLIGWFEAALVRLHQSPFLVPFLNYPEGWNLAYTEVPLTMVVPALPISLVAGPVAAYNVSVFSSYVFSGLIPYVWVKRITGETMSGLLAGSVFAFSPFRYSHFLAGHLNLLGTHWIALYFLSFVECLLDRGRRKAYPLIAGLSLGMVALTSQYYLYMTLLLSLMVLIVKLALVDRGAPTDSGLPHRLGLLALVGLPLVLVAEAPFLQVGTGGNLPARSVEYVRQYSASPTDFILPATTSALWGNWVGENFDRSYWIEATLYLGVGAVILASIGVVRAARQSWHRGRVVLVLALALGAALLALGTDLHWLSKPVLIRVPSILRTWYPRDLAHLPLPGRILFEWLPFYDRMRVWMRYGAFAGLGVSVLAGWGSAWVARGFSGWRRYGMSVALLVLVVLDFLPKPQPYVRVESRPVDDWLASQTAPGALVEFPFDRVGDQAQIYYTLTHKKPFLGGLFNAFSPPQYRRIKPVMDAFPDLASVDMLKLLGVRYVLVHSKEYADFEETDRLIRALGLRWSSVFGEIYVYEIDGVDVEP